MHIWKVIVGNKSSVPQYALSTCSRENKAKTFLFSENLVYYYEKDGLKRDETGGREIG